jgi:aminopeptidase N
VTENNLTRDEAAERARLLAVTSYDVLLDLTDGSGEKPGEDTFGSTTTIRFTCNEPGAATHVDLTAPSLTSATLNGEALDVASVFDGNRIQRTGLAADN